MIKKIILSLIVFCCLALSVNAQTQKFGITFLGNKTTLQEATLRCPVVGAVYYNTTASELRVCTAAGNPGTFASVGSGGGGGASIGGVVTGATQGSVFFAGALGVMAQDNTNFFYDDTDNKLRIGASAGQKVQVKDNFIWVGNPSFTNSDDYALSGDGINTQLNAYGTLTLRYRNGVFDYLSLHPTIGNTFAAGVSTRIPLIIDGAASQSANLQDWKVNGTLKSYIDNSGGFNTSIITSLPGNSISIYSYLGMRIDAYNAPMVFYYNGTPRGQFDNVGFQMVPSTPASSAATCTAGNMNVDASYIYVCTATNTWKRVALTAF